MVDKDTRSNQHHVCSKHDGHKHQNQSLLFYFLGVFIYIIAWFVSSLVLRDVLFLTGMIFSGYHVMWEGLVETIQQSKVRKRFTPNIHILMTLAAIGAVLIGDINEGALLILIFSGAHFLEEYAENRSRQEITNLLNQNPKEARRFDKNGQTHQIAASEIKVGDLLLVLPGDQIATDGKIVSGSSDIDEAAINGESIPKEKSSGDEVFGGTINGLGTFTMEATKNNSETVFAKILQLIDQSQKNLSPTATRIKKIEPYYVTIVLIVVSCFILLTPFLFNWSWYTSFYRGMVLLISASPCALAASAVPAGLSALSNLATAGILFKGVSYLSHLAEIKAVGFDKTGTLTVGKPQVTEVYFEDSADQERWQNIIVAMEKQANHPLARAIIAHFMPTQEYDLEAQNKLGKGITTVFEGKSYRIGKPESFNQLSEKMLQKVQQAQAKGKIVVCFAENEKTVGLIVLADLPNTEAKKVVAYFKKNHIQTVMITGDSKQTGEAIGSSLGIDQVISDVLPEDKSKNIDKLKQMYGPTAMIGDGINDAPALVLADVGIAMGEGADAAIDVSDGVIMKNDLSKFSIAHQTALKLDKIVNQNIIISFVVILLLILLNVLGKVNIGGSVFIHEGSTLLVILNGLRLLLPIKNDADFKE